MTKNATYGDLWNIHMDIQLQSQRSPAFQALLHNRIKDFYNHNNMRIRILQEKMDALVAEFVQHDENLKPLTLKNDKGITEWKFETPENRETYIKRYNELMSIQIMITA